MAGRVNMTKKALLLVLLLLIVNACSTIQPIPFQRGKLVSAPMGVLDLINNRSDRLEEFRVEKTMSNELVPEAELVFVLQDILEEMLENFEEVSDYEHYGKSEYWAAPSESTYYDIFGFSYFAGDCDEFAMRTWTELKKRGIKARLVVARTEENIRHVVVESGGWILDNRYPYVVANNELDYEWIKISGHDLREPWHQALKPDIGNNKTL